ncbi:MAG: hypothetical protein HYS51_00410 [Candidatus Zambryskibacteria bacterium]|nr:hypothetical protein [Candidatus Zambryskibacteria bacterium]
MRLHLPLMIIALVAPVSATAEMKVTFLDVGQGDAAVVQISQQGEPFTILIDAGPKAADFAKGLPTVLRLAQDRSIELVVISHPHKDHTAGLPCWKFCQWRADLRRFVKRNQQVRTNTWLPLQIPEALNQLLYFVKFSQISRPWFDTLY